MMPLLPPPLLLPVLTRLLPLPVLLVLVLLLVAAPRHLGASANAATSNALAMLPFSNFRWITCLKPALRLAELPPRTDRQINACRNASRNVLERKYC